MPLIEITQEQLDREFEIFHDPESSIRAIAEAKRPNSADPFDGANMVKRFEQHVGDYVSMFGEAVDDVVDLSKRDNEILK